VEAGAIAEMLTDKLGERVTASTVAYGTTTVTLDADGYAEAARLCRDDPRLEFDFFDCLSGVDERDDGFAVVAVLWSTKQRHRVLLRHVCAGGRDKPVAPSLSALWRGANWHEREAWDMFGIEFDGHPGLAPRILCTENFEGWPLRKDFPLATREAKPWPGAKEPEEQHAPAATGEHAPAAEDDAPAPAEGEAAPAEERGGTAAERADRARAKAAEARARAAAARAAAEAAEAEAVAEEGIAAQEEAEAVAEEGIAAQVDAVEGAEAVAEEGVVAQADVAEEAETPAEEGVAAQADAAEEADAVAEGTDTPEPGGSDMTGAGTEDAADIEDAAEIEPPAADDDEARP